MPWSRRKGWKPSVLYPACTENSKAQAYNRHNRLEGKKRFNDNQPATPSTWKELEKDQHRRAAASGKQIKRQAARQFD